MAVIDHLPRPGGAPTGSPDDGIRGPGGVPPRRAAGPRGRRQRWGLRARAAIAMGLTALVLSVSLAALAYAIVRAAVLDERESAAVRQAYGNARVVRGALRAAEPDVADLLSGLQLGPGGGAVLVTPTGTYASSVDIAVDDVPDDLQAGVRDNRAGRQRALESEPYLVVGVPIATEGAQYYELSSLEEAERTLDVLASALAAGGLVATGVGVTVGLAVSGAVLRPLRRVADAAHRIVGGQLDTRLDVERDRDIAPLAEAFNAMVDDLRDRIEHEARFASDVTHELRGPLTVLAATVSIVERRRDALPPEAAEAIDALQDQVVSFNRLVLDLLEISRFDAGTARLETRDVDIERLVRASLAERDGGPIPLRIGLSDSARHVRADPRRLHQVLANLLDNAANYAGGATAVTIDGDGATVRLGVEDSGPGVGAGERSTVFDRFARGAASEHPGAPRGSGLGLALAADHVRLHGGHIWVEDAPSGGARFVVELPVAPA